MNCLSTYSSTPILTLLFFLHTLHGKFGVFVSGRQKVMHDVVCLCTSNSTPFFVSCMQTRAVTVVPLSKVVDDRNNARGAQCTIGGKDNFVEW